MRPGHTLEVPEGTAAAAPLANEWQPPSVALNRFVPSAGARRSTTADAAATLRYGFRAAGIGLLLAEATGAELVSQGEVAPVPNAPFWLTGLMNLRGNLVPIVDMQAALGIGAAANPGAAMPRTSAPLVLVFGKSERAMGVLIEAAPQALRNLQAVEQSPPLPERLAPHAGAGYVEKQDFWVEFKHDSFFESLAAEGAGA